MTTQNEINCWFDEGKEQGSTYLIVVCDTFDYEDYPVFADSDIECRISIESYDGPNMQKVMEVYDLRMNKELQLNQVRCRNEPKS